QTVEGHLASAIEVGEIESIDRLVPPNRQRTIEIAIDQCDDDTLRSVRDLLGDDYNYGEIRFVKAILARENR
ncbi:MAG TPA: helix-turn-helix domain-containing protein, partial [Nitrolancea sp.]|nr:helix-turn-helix domain-containing protein [Nitrolancea sp.]